MHHSSECIGAIAAALAKARSREDINAKIAQGVMAFNKLCSRNLLRLVNCGGSFTGNLGLGRSSIMRFSPFEPCDR